MNKDHCNIAVKLAGAFLLTSVATAEQNDQSYYVDSTDSLTFSMRFGLNMSGKFLGTGSGFDSASPYGGRLTPSGDPYNYADGYVLPGSTGNANNATHYWGYDSASQLKGTPNNYSMDFDRYSPAGVPQGNDSLYDPRIGAELTYNHQLGVKDNWHHLRFGLEVAANYTPVSFHNSYDGPVSLTDDQYSYSFGPYVTYVPPPDQVQGISGGGGIGSYPSLQPTPSSFKAIPLAGTGTFLAQQDFHGDLWGFRLGPYLELPLTRKLSAHLSGGFAVGLLDDSVSWNETLVLPNGGDTVRQSGSGADLAALAGGYVRLDFAYQVSRHWAAEIGAQFQDLGTYGHNFAGRTVDLDLSQSIFVEAGISYKF